MFRVHEGRHPAEFLGLRDHLQGQRRLARCLRPVDLDHAPARHAADAEGVVEADGAGGDEIDRGDGALLTEAHDRPLAELLLDLADGHVQGFRAFVPIVGRHGWLLWVVLLSAECLVLSAGAKCSATAPAEDDTRTCILVACRPQSQAKIAPATTCLPCDFNNLAGHQTFAHRPAAGRTGPNLPPEARSGAAESPIAGFTPV